MNHALLQRVEISETDGMRGADGLSVELRVASLFAGIGGFDKAFESVSASVVAQCEIDSFCRAVLRRHWPQTKLFEDITKINPAEFPAADIWTAGFPCQDVSLARGNHGRDGLKGNHTSLFFKLMDLAEAKKPKIILLENVVGLLNSHQGCDFAIILRELTNQGYAVSWRVLNARYFGSPQSRSRVFMVAWRGDYRLALASLFEPVRGAKTAAERKGFVTKTTHAKTGAIVPQVAYCVAATSGRHTGNDWARSYISYKDRVRRPTVSESERLQGFEAGWTVPGAGYREPARGFDSERYRAVGNAVAVPVVRWIAQRMTAALAQPKAPSSRRGFMEECLLIAPDLANSTETLRFSDIMEEVNKGEFVYRWKGCGVAWGNNIVEGATAPAPSQVVDSRFVNLLDNEVPDDRYFLTPNAAIGILRRADSVGRTLFGPMREALENMVKCFSAADSPRVLAGEQIAKVSIRPPRTNKRGNSQLDRSIAVRATRISY
ncbi:DNA-cytosine methyltransferase [Rhodopseudomonas palustris BisB5]|uniref:DNA (cytosine-5-)-methyltransferase n=1 Tax=Rhodopseudomonas palustris (strain BisB5) TaxID=316057 RepID=Q139N2_RHOPS|nr:DNA-cytosine methyltransferase [Rhodopseudomonas palustris BisB5]